MTVHQLEIFYHVASHHGISRAVRHIPYGIQQPAVSGHMSALEQDLGKRLFERKPFRLTPAGEELFAFVQPFFGNLAMMEQRLRKTADPQLRIGASEIALRDHLPLLLDPVRASHPRLRMTFRSGFQSQMEAALQDDEIDLAITPLETRPPARIKCLKLVRLPLVLLAPRELKVRSAAELWRERVVEQTLISLPSSETVSRLFQRDLKRLRVEWPIGMEASSLDLVTRYVANGYGIGLSVAAGDIVRHPRVRVLPLPGFASMEIAVFWKGELSPLVREVVTAMQRYAVATWPDWAVGEKLA